MIQKGQKINDRYEIIRAIGEGGMANVYLAYDTILNRNVAVKILRGDLANDEKFVRRFQREAIAASSLNHPNIVNMYDVGEDEGKYFIVMEYLEGQTLKTLIKKRGALTLSEVIDIMLQLTSGLAHAHESYIIHRDIKPQNVIILDDGTVKITDFGIATALNSNELTQTNSVMGSVHYLPPEQANGSGSTVQSDIYSSGIMMYELLTGKLPYKGDNAVEIAIKHMKEAIPSVCEINPDIPQAVENVILKACAKNPKNRYQSAREMHDDLMTCLDKNRSAEFKHRYEYPEIEENEKVKEVTNEQKEKDAKQEKKLNKALIVTGVITAILAIVAVIMFVILPLTAKNKEVEVPDVSGKTVKKAEQILEKAGFEVKDEVTEQESEEVEAGKVIKTTPKAGRTVKKGATITLVVSKEKDKITLEDYTGKKYDDVKYLLEKQGITVNKEEKEFTKDDNKTDGTIVSQDKAKGTEVEKDASITFTVAKVITVYPDFVNENYTIDDVQTFCDDNGITLEKTAKETNDYAENSIITQSRQAGTKVVSGVTLRVTYAVRKEETKSPNTTNKTNNSTSIDETEEETE